MYVFILSLIGGMAYEAMNNAAYINTRVVVILNDNGQVSLPTGRYGCMVGCAYVCVY